MITMINVKGSVESLVGYPAPEAEGNRFRARPSKARIPQ